MTQISQKLQKICKQIRTAQKQSRLKQLRQQILRNWSQQAFPNSIDQLFKLTILKLEQPEPDFLNIYVNIKDLLNNCLFSNKPADKLEKKVALWIFIKLTFSQEVLNFMFEYDMRQNWKNFFHLLHQQLKCREYLYQAMKRFLETACYKFHITPYHNLESIQLSQAVKYIFNQQITKSWISIEPQQDEDSQYHQFMATYVSLVPKQHIIPIVNDGFPLRVLQLQNKKVFYSILSRLQSLSEEQQCFSQIFESLVQKKEEIELIFHEF